MTRKIALVIILAFLLLALLTCCLGVKSEKSDCGYSSHESICTDTWLIREQATANVGSQQTATSEAEK